MLQRIRLARRSEKGQIVVLFALLLVIMVAMVGLVLDGGSALAQRRDEQNASDLAALAGANTYLLTADTNAAITAARAVAQENGYTHGSGNMTVDVSVNTSAATVTVYINAPHENSFGGVIGFDTWDVATTATALAGIPDGAEGPAPMSFSIDVFNSDGTPKAQFADKNSPFAFGEVSNDDAPTGPGDFAWTNYGTGNVNTNDVEDILDGDLVISKTINFGEYIGQHNSGEHTALFDKTQDCDSHGSVNKCLAGTDVPVPIVDHNGNFQGWATFHVVSAEGGSVKKVNGYFKSGFISNRLTVGCTINTCPRYLGTWSLKLID
jgi:Flp pilus assembly protein TadG